METFDTRILNIDTKKLDLISDRIEQLLEERGCTKIWLASKLGLSKQALNYLLKYKKKPTFISEIAEIFNVNPRWLETGVGNKILKTSSMQCDFIPVYSLKKFLTTLSLDLSITENKIINFCENNEIFAVVMDCEFEHITKFDKNTILLFDSQKKPTNGDYVLIKIKHETISYIFFSEFKEENALITINYNQSNKGIPEKKCNILGTLVETRVRF